MKRHLPIVLLLIASVAFADGVIKRRVIEYTPSVELDDSYSESNYVAGITWYLKSLATGATRIGQSFTSGGGELDSAKFYIKKEGSPTGNATANIYSHSGTYGVSSITDNGSLLATSGTLDVSTLTTSMQLITLDFTGADRITLTAGYYVVILEYSNGDNDNLVWLGADNTSPTHGGNVVYYTESGSGWGYEAAHDIIFYVYVVR